MVAYKPDFDYVAVYFLYIKALSSLRVCHVIFQQYLTNSASSQLTITASWPYHMIITLSYAPTADIYYCSLATNYVSTGFEYAKVRLWLTLATYFSVYLADTCLNVIITHIIVNTYIITKVY